MNSIIKRKTIILLPLLLILICTRLNAQLNVVAGTGLTPLQLVQNNLLGGGVTISNVTYCGSSAFITYNNIGSFTTGGNPTNLGLSSGLVLASGGVLGAPGPNNSSSSTTTVQPTTPDMSDPDLLTLVSGGATSLHDAAILEFDFVPISDTVKFRYVFGSDEYPEFVNEFDDVFGFFITGQNPTGPAYVKQNIALLPGTTTPISINTVNNGSSNAGPCVNCSYYVNNTSGTSIQADAFTTVLTAWAKVVPCTQYHIKLAIADANDRAYDSWVWLEANSFTSNGLSFLTSFTNPNAIPVAIAGCNNEILKFITSQYSLDTTWIVIDTIYGTAVNGVDFQFIGDSVAILPGQTAGSITISPIPSNVPGPMKYVIIKFNTTICGADSVYIPIMPYSPLHITTNNDTTICQTFPAQTTVSLVGTATGGNGSTYYYSWSPAGSLNNPNIANPIATPALILGSSTPQYIQYMLTLTDSTGCPSDTSSVLITLNSFPQISFDASPFKGCEPVTVVFSNGTEPSTSTYLWNFGDNSPTETSINPTHTYNSTGSPFTVTLIATNAACKDTFSAPNYIKVYPQPHAEFIWDPSTGVLSNPIIYFTNTTTPINPTFINTWDFGDGVKDNTMNPSHLFTSPNTFDVVLIVTTDSANGNCSDTARHSITIIADSLVFPNIITPNGDNINDNFVIKGLEKGAYPTNKLVVYNRWGKKVYESSNYQNSTFDGAGLPDGVYYYIFTAKSVLREIKHQSSLEILR